MICVYITICVVQCAVLLFTACICDYSVIC